MAAVRPVERAYAEAVAGLPRVTDEIRDVAWMLEEFRVSLFAQPVGYQGPVSAKRIRDAFAAATGTALP